MNERMGIKNTRDPPGGSYGPHGNRTEHTKDKKQFEGGTSHE